MSFNNDVDYDLAQLRPLQQEHLDAVLAIIAEVDEDDAEEAAESYRENGLDDQYVLMLGEQIFGVTGFRPALATEGSCWLSWTYLLPALTGRGLGRRMLNELIDILKKSGARKLFVSSSDYVDPEDGAIYEAAHKLYKAVGFIEELCHPDYYQPLEAEIIYGLRLSESEPVSEIAADDSIVFFNGLNEIPETEGCCVINWDVAKKKKFTLHRQTQFTELDLQIGIDQAVKDGMRAIFISFPSNMPSVIEPLQVAGFFEEGRLKDYYEDGVDEVHYRINL